MARLFGVCQSYHAERVVWNDRSLVYRGLSVERRSEPHGAAWCGKRPTMKELVVDGARPLIERDGRTDLELVIEEILQDKIAPTWTVEDPAEEEMDDSVL